VSAVALNVTGSNSSAVFETPAGPVPPASSTLPLGSNVAVWLTRAWVSGPEVTVLIVVPNRACRVVASKYRRNPTALLWPAHLVLSGLVPIRVQTFSDSASVVPLNAVGAKEPNAVVASRALAGFRTIPVIQRVNPDATRVPFLYTSARRSKLVP